MTRGAPAQTGRIRPVASRQRPLRSPCERRFEAFVFDWDGTAVPDRAADATEVRTVLEALCARGAQAFVVTGTHIGNVDPQLAARPDGPGELFLLLNRGSEVFHVTRDGPLLVHRRRATPEEEAALDRAAELTVQRLAEHGLRAEIVSQRLNRRKIDLIPEPEWLDPPKARIAELLVAVERRLREVGIGSLAAAVEIGRAAAEEAGVVAPRVTSDAKHVEIGLTDKADSARWAFAHLRSSGITPAQVLVLGDEFGPLGGVPGSDSMLLVEAAREATVVSVGAEPLGVPPGIVHLGGGPRRSWGSCTTRCAAATGPSSRMCRRNEGGPRRRRRRPGDRARRRGAAHARRRGAGHSGRAAAGSSERGAAGPAQRRVRAHRPGYGAPSLPRLDEAAR